MVTTASCAASGKPPASATHSMSKESTRKGARREKAGDGACERSAANGTAHSYWHSERCAPAPRNAHLLRARQQLVAPGAQLQPVAAHDRRVDEEAQHERQLRLEDRVEVRVLRPVDGRWGGAIG